MNQGIRRVAASSLLSLLGLLVQAPAFSASNAAAPYFQVLGEDVERLPLMLTDVGVDIAGVIADVSVRQVYENRGQRPIEAVYVFPGSPRSAVYAMRVSIGERVIEAVIRGEEEAREEYETALDEGRTAGLLEQLDEGVFQMNVANILPGDRIEVTLKYTEVLIPTSGVYEFVFPNTMGERYDDGSGPGVSAPVSSAPEVTDYGFSIHARVQSALALQSVDSPSHAVHVERPDDYNADVTLDEGSLRTAGTSDFRLRYRLAGDQVQSGVLVYPEADGGYFLLMAEPPRRVQDHWIPPREFIFVVDVSGSMAGEPLNISKRLMTDLVHSLKPGDRFNLVLFAGSSSVLSETGSLPANAETVEHAIKLLNNQNAGGGTELLPALERAYTLQRDPAYARSIIIVTDGAIWADGHAFRLIRSHLGEANAFAFGIGPSVERNVIERLARAGAGEPFIVQAGDDGAETAARLRQYIDRPLLTHIRIEPSGFDAYDFEPSQVPDLLAERPVTVVGRYRGEPTGALRIDGRIGREPYAQVVEIGRGASSSRNAALRQLWARTRIQRLLDDESTSFWGGQGETIDNKAQITRLGLEYALLTPYTSFVAVDRIVRTDESAVAVQQPAFARQEVEPNERVEYEPLPPPLPASPASTMVTNTRIRGRGFVHATGAALGIVVAAAHAPRATSTTNRHVGPWQLEQREGIWTDRHYRPGLPMLRIRLGSPAHQRLMDLLPSLAPSLAPSEVDSEPMLVVIGNYAVLFSNDGFSDYPDEILMRVAATSSKDMHTRKSSNSGLLK